MSKKFLPSLSILFVALLLLQSVVSIFVYDAQLKSIRRKFKWETLLSLPDYKLTLVKVSKSLEEKPNTFFKRIHGREFQFMGEMYDIVRKSEFADSTYYYCFHDNDESEIIRNINRWMHDNFGKPGNNSEKGKMLTEIFKQPYIANTITQLFPPKVICLNIINNTFPILLLPSQTFSPPPEMS